MQSLRIILLTAIICGLVNAHPRLKSRPLRIINGQTVDPPHSIPYQVLLILGTDPVWDLRFCGGVLLTEEWVLTSANCTQDMVIAYGEAYLGSQNISAEEDEQQFSVVKFYVTHEDFNPDTMANNLGLVQLENIVTFTDAVQPINLTTKSEIKSKLVGQHGIISGWGSRNANDFEEITYVLQYAETEIVNDTLCTQSDKYIDVSTHLCAKSDTNSHIYGTDFGGPLVVNGTTLVGISSKWSGLEEDLDLFVDISQYLQWISEITGIPVS